MVRRRSTVRFRNGALQLDGAIRKKFVQAMSAPVGPNGCGKGHRELSRRAQSRVAIAHRHDRSQGRPAAISVRVARRAFRVDGPDCRGRLGGRHAIFEPRSGHHAAIRIICAGLGRGCAGKGSLRRSRLWAVRVNDGVYVGDGPQSGRRRGPSSCSLCRTQPAGSGRLGRCTSSSGNPTDSQPRSEDPPTVTTTGESDTGRTHPAASGASWSTCSTARSHAASSPAIRIGTHAGGDPRRITRASTGSVCAPLATASITCRAVNTPHVPITTPDPALPGGAHTSASRSSQIDPTWHYLCLEASRAGNALGRIESNGPDLPASSYISGVNVNVCARSCPDFTAAPATSGSSLNHLSPAGPPSLR